jgi:signal transduction histidine kinase
LAADGSVEAIAAVVLEVTHQKKAEAALIQSEKLAAVGRLASSISHEINNPLEAITNLLYLIGLSDDLPESTRQYLQTAQSELSRVCQIATQTLRFHRQAVRATRVSASDLVDAVLNLYQGRLANSHIQVDARYATSTTILCFENDIRQVLNNLIANAIDAMRPGGGRLIVRAHDATDYSPDYSQPRHGIRITIADTGHGMSATVKARLFEPFYTTKDLNGTGLGLWISAGIVTRHQGKLSYRSSEHPIHHGTIFSLFLSSAEVDAPALS